MAGLASVKVTVHGRVTGIGFRAFARAQARALGLTGYARNLPGESVEIEAEGDRDKLEKLVARLRTGSPLARVEKMDVAWSEYSGNYPDFTIRPSV
ncbi:MAG: acylphosphatase [Chloroflexi bacterium]|nr:acylphosphatase [Chloroflexota bacterium]